MRVVNQNPKDAYAGLQKSLQHEWYFMQCATQGLGEDFDLGEKDLSENFLLDIFLGVDSKIPEWDAPELP